MSRRGLSYLAFTFAALVGAQQWYNPENEPPHYKCRRDPTWRSVDYAECQELTGWYPPDTYWRKDKAQTKRWLRDKYDALPECLYQKLDDAKEKYEWCDESNKTAKACHVEALTFMGHYYTEEQGQLVTLSNAFTEQEAFAVEALSECIQEVLPPNTPFHEIRAFGENETTDVYNPQGGNYCTFVNGLLQLYLPGVAATIYGVIEYVVEDLDWTALDMYHPRELGIRTAEFLKYKKTGKLGLHVDGGSVYSMSVALSDMDDYQGGYFQLTTNDALFKVPRRGAIIFWSESSHGITDITSGERKVFVTELWNEEDVPAGRFRPNFEQFEEHKKQRRKHGVGVEKEEKEEEEVSEEGKGEL